MGGTFWECTKPRYSCRKRYRGKWKSLWYLGCEGRFVLMRKELATVLKGLKK